MACQPAWQQEDRHAQCNLQDVPLVPPLKRAYPGNVLTPHYSRKLTNSFPYLANPLEAALRTCSIVQHMIQSSRLLDAQALTTEVRRLIPGWNPPAPYFKHLGTGSESFATFTEQKQVLLEERRWEGPPRKMQPQDATRFADTGKRSPTMDVADLVVRVVRGKSMTKDSIHADGWWWWWWWWWRSHPASTDRYTRAARALTSLLHVWMVEAADLIFSALLPLEQRRVLFRHVYGELSFLRCVLSMSSTQRKSLIAYLATYSTSASNRSFFSKLHKREEVPGALDLATTLAVQAGVLSAVIWCPDYPEARLLHRASFLWIDRGAGREWNEPRWHSSPKNLRVMDEKDLPGQLLREILPLQLFRAFGLSVGPVTPAQAQAGFTRVDAMTDAALARQVVNVQLALVADPAKVLLEKFKAARLEYMDPTIAHQSVMTRCVTVIQDHEIIADVGVVLDPRSSSQGPGRNRAPGLHVSAGLHESDCKLSPKDALHRLKMRVLPLTLNLLPAEADRATKSIARQTVAFALCRAVEPFVWKLVHYQRDVH